MTTNTNTNATTQLYDFYRPHARVQTYIGEQVITKQEFKDECDIHNILSQYKQTGIITHITKNRASYEDLPDNIDYQDALNLVLQADESFQTLPASVRDKYHNNPQEFLAAMYDPTKEDELRELGVLPPKPLPSPTTSTPPTSPPPPAGGEPAKPA